MGCASMRRTRSSTAPRCPCSRRRRRRGGSRPVWGRRLAVIAESDLNDPRVLGPRQSEATVLTRNEPGFPPRAARALSGEWNRVRYGRLRPDRRPGYRPLRGVRRTPAATPRTAAPSRPANRWLGATRSSDACKTSTIRWATRPRRPERAATQSRPARDRRRSRATAPFVPTRSGPRSGGRAHRFCTSRITQQLPESGAPCSGARRIRRVRPGPERDSRSAGPGDVRAPQAGGASRAARLTRRSSMAFAASSACGAASRISPTAASTRCESPSTSATSGS